MAYFPTPNTKQRKTLTCCGFQSNEEKGEAHPLAPYTHSPPLSPHSSHLAVASRVSQHRPPTSATEKGRCPRRLRRGASQNKPRPFLAGWPTRPLKTRVVGVPTILGPSVGLRRNREGLDGAETESGGEQVVLGRRHARRRVGPGDGRTFSPTSRLGAGGGGERRRLRAPGPNAAWPGSAASARGAPPGRYLPSSRARMGRCCCGSGWRGGGRGGRRGPRGPLPPSTTSSRASGGSDDYTAGPGRVTSGGGNSRAPPPLDLALHLPCARRPPSLLAPPLRPGAGAAATCARGRPAHRNRRRAHPGSSRPALQRPPPSGAGARCPKLRASSAAVPLGGESEPLIPTQHGGGVRGGFPRRRRLRGREEEALLHAESRPTAPLPALRTLRPQTGPPRQMELGSRILPPVLFTFPFDPLSVVPRALGL